MEYRLKRQSEFNEVFKKGKRAYAKSISILYVIKKELKIGISVSKKHGNAVIRNRIKRLIRASVFEKRKDLKPVHIVFLPKVGINFSFNEIKEEILYLLNKEKLLIETD